MSAAAAPIAGPSSLPAGPERLVVPALCQPSLLADLPSADAISHLLAKHIPPHLRPVRDTMGTFPPNEAPHDPDLAHAMRTNAWRRIAVFARERIISAGAPSSLPLVAGPQAQGHSEGQRRSGVEPAGPNDVSTVLRWWNVRLQALLRLRLYSQFRLELESLWAILKRTTIPRHLAAAPTPQQQQEPGEGSAPAYIRPTVRYARLLDSPVVPFALHVLRAREPLLAGEPRAALEKCHALLQRCRVMQRRFVRVAEVDGRQAGEEEVERGARAEAALWEDRARRMTVIIAFILLDFEDYSAAISLLRPLISEQTTTPTQQAYTLLLARLFLEAGAVDSAQACLRSVSAVLQHPPQDESSPESSDITAALRRLLNVTEALIAMWRGAYSDSEAKLQSTLPSKESESQGQSDADPAVVNNLALSTFYQGRVDEATTLLERLLQDEPSAASSAEAVIFNLITMHELRSDEYVHSLSHKRRILVHVAQWAGDGGGTSCLKLA
ncbi:hypothetical protein OC842_001158 [Tilletia horrida]|uniref:Uncharacterized protein n=1 Tax=Tilletia horrida TaxID=155126 RepID=A0AAN6JTF8_9BASI|nr:hypothetical protein OC842_001158 [Tilletia horrida]